MRSISPNNPVRRRLVFDDNVEEQAKNENFSNVLQESIVRERKEMTNKWNFDFFNEKALKGRYVWYKKDGDDWIKMKHEDGIQFDNENTPAHSRINSLPEIRKRRSEVEKKCNQSVKRRIL